MKIFITALLESDIDIDVSSAIKFIFIK